MRLKGNSLPRAPEAIWAQDLQIAVANYTVNCAVTLFILAFDDRKWSQWTSGQCAEIKDFAKGVKK